MNVVDCQPARVKRLLPALGRAQTLIEALRLLRLQRAIEAEVAQGFAEVQRAARGWCYLPPAASKS